MTIDLKSTREGTSLEILVAPRASRARVLGVHAGALKIALTAPPVDGAANAALTEHLAELFGVAKGAVRIVRGQASRKKTVEIAGRAPEAILAALESLVPSVRVQSS